MRQIRVLMLLGAAIGIVAPLGAAGRVEPIQAQNEAPPPQGFRIIGNIYWVGESVQQEVFPRVSVEAGYHRRNFDSFYDPSLLEGSGVRPGNWQFGILRGWAAG